MNERDNHDSFFELNLSHSSFGSIINENEIINNLSIKPEKKENKPKSNDSSFCIEDLNYFSEKAQERDLKQKFLNDNLFPIELVKGDNNDSIEKLMTFCDVITSSLYLGITNFGVMQVKEKKIFLYFVVKKKLMEEHNFIKLFSICEIIPGATLIQIILSIYYIKTKSFLLSLIGIILFLLPGILCLIIAFLILNKFLTYIYNKQLFIIVEMGIAQSAFSLLLNFLTVQFLKLLNSNFQSGIVIITVGTLLINDSLLFIVCLYCVMGFLSMKKSEQENLFINNTGMTLYDTIRFSPSYFRYFAIFLFLILFCIFSFFSYVIKIDTDHLFFKFYTMGSLVFMDYSAINFLKSYLNLNLNDIIISFGFVCLFQGHIFNLLIVLMISHGIPLTLLYLLSAYLPSILLGYAGLKGIHKITNNSELILFLRGVRTTSLGLIFSLIPSLFKSICLNNKLMHWSFASLIVLFGWYWFYKRKFLLGNILTIGSSILVSLLEQHFLKKEENNL